MKDLMIDCDSENKGTIDSVDAIRVIEGKCKSFLVNENQIEFVRLM